MSSKSVAYMERTKRYYFAQGYDAAYQWAHHKETPFQPLLKPLSEARATLVTTTMPDSSFTREHRRLHRGSMDRVPGQMYTGDLAWDTQATHTEDLGSYFPIIQLMEAVSERRIGGLTDHYYCVPTEYSQRRTIERDAPQILQSCQQEDTDIALLVPL
jgi:hypothetical protein